MSSFGTCPSRNRRSKLKMNAFSMSYPVMVCRTCKRRSTRALLSGVIPPPVPASTGAAIARQRMSPSLAPGRISPALGALNVAVNFQQQHQPAAVNAPLMQRKCYTRTRG